MFYMLFDNPECKENMTFLTEGKTAVIKLLFPKNRCSTMKQMLRACVSCIKQTKTNDTLICWYDFMGVICWWICKLTAKRRNIVALNLLLKDKNTIKNKIAKFLYKRPLKSKNFTATVTSEEYGKWINDVLGLKNEYILLHDIYHKNYAYEYLGDVEFSREKDILSLKKQKSVFCGGRNGRNWKLFFELAKVMSDVQFNCIMPGNEYKKYESYIKNADNVYALYDVPEDDFIRVLRDSNLVILPLDTQAPAGLIVFFQASAQGKMVITSDTVTTREYIKDDSGVRCKNSVKNWVEQIRYYLEHPEIAEKKSLNLRKFLERECSEECYASVLSSILDYED